MTGVFGCAPRLFAGGSRCLRGLSKFFLPLAGQFSRLAMLVTDLAHFLSKSSQLLRIVSGGLRNHLRCCIPAVVFGTLTAAVGLRCGVVQKR